MLTRLSLGGFDVQVHLPYSLSLDHEIYRHFTFTSNVKTSFPQIKIEVVNGDIDEFFLREWQAGTLHVDNEATWSLRLTGDAQWPYHFGPPPRGIKDPPVFHILVNSDFSQAKVFLGRNSPHEIHPGQLFPLDEVLTRHLLHCNQGVILHASGVCIGEKGHLFLGDSGAGKSTIATLFEERLGAGCIFSDDRIIVRYQNGRWWMYGSPWHGTFNRVLARGVEISSLNFIEQTSGHELESLKRSEALVRLLKVFLAIWWMPDAARKQLDLLEQMVLSPALQFNRLGFALDLSVTDFFMEQIKSSQ